MAAIRFAWSSYKHRGLGLLLVVLPITLLFVLVTMFVSLEVVLKAQEAPGVDERLFRMSPNGPPLLRAADLQKLSAIPGVENVAAKARLSCASNDANPTKIVCAGTDTAFIHMSAKGQYVPPDVLAQWAKQRNGVIVGGDLAAKYNWQVGQPLGLVINKKPNTDFVVSYVTSKGSHQSELWFHTDGADAVRGADAGSYDSAWVETRTAADRDAVIKQVETQFEGASSIMTIIRAEDIKSLLLGASKLIIALLRGTGILSLGIVVFTILAMLTISTEARRVELATLRAIGFRRSTILATVILEAVLIVLPGALLGAFATFFYFSNHPFQMSDIGRFAFKPGLLDVGVAVALGVAAAALIGAIPGRRAAQVDILQTIRGG
ncbi:MAG: ABC transporter permease [Polyangia bacterium]